MREGTIRDKCREREKRDQRRDAGADPSGWLTPDHTLFSPKLSVRQISYLHAGA
ncbi:unnamed protein product [Mycena citricolor]|uniref:Uncharacterized protein n=1 Tax=Mycena citricolor TaxID=2018698 RepID=A0AAD2HKY0_9AGAR|nr:unnamed protein product [Mycena citricolor]